MNRDRPPPPRELKPWYYQDWFLFPVFVFWPVWAVLILRSPWHNGLISGAVAWAMLIVGGFEIFWLQLVESGGLSDITITLILPGLILTVLTQALWLRDRRRLTRADRQGPEAASTQSQRTSNQRRGRRRRNRPSRNSRRR